MKRKIIELLIRLWMPGYHLARTRGPYHTKMKQATPEQVEKRKGLVNWLDAAKRNAQTSGVGQDK